MVFASEGLWKVWTWCLMKANHRDAWVPMTTGKGTTEVLVKRGQFIFGRKTASKELKQSGTTISDRMKKLERAQNIVMQSVTHYSVVTVLNWETYQCDDFKPASQPVNQPSTNRQPTVTNKNDKNEKKERAHKLFEKPTLEEVTAYCLERKNSINSERWIAHYEANGWMVGRNKMRDWRASVRYWEKTGFNDKPAKTLEKSWQP